MNIKDASLLVSQQKKSVHGPDTLASVETFKVIHH